MKFECTTEKLREVVSVATRFTAKNANLPVIKNILLVAEGRTLTVRATNLECGVELSLPASIETDGVCAVGGDTFLGFVGNIFNEKNISCRKEGDVLKCTTSKAKAVIKTVPSDDFPTLPSVSAEKSFAISGDALAKMIRAVGFCASVSGVKPELQSVLLYGEAGKLYAVATDSFRLAEKRVPAKRVASLPHILIPIKNAAELAKILDGVSSEVDIYYSEHQLSARIDGAYYTTRLIDAAFPNYRAILPKAHTTEAVILREDLTRALKLIAVFADKFSQVSIAVQPKQKSVLLSARNSDVGENTVELKSSIEGPALEMTFNGRYIADALQSIVGDSVKFGWSGPGKPLGIESISDQSFTYIVMPMNRQ